MREGRAPIVAITIASLALRLATAIVIAQPGYTDAYYYADVASRLARGLGLTADFVWGPLELGPLPVASHRFWMPLATALQAIGIAPLGTLLGEFRAAQAVIVAIAALVPPAAWSCARALGASQRGALVAAAVVGLGGLFAPAWVTLDGFAVAALLGALFFTAFARAARGSAAAGAAAGLLVGALFLTRAEAAIFGVALLPLMLRPATRAAGLAGAVVALAIGTSWLARDIALGTTSDFVARTTLLTRYEDFFSLRPPATDIFNAPLGDVLGARAGALVTNAGTFLFAYAIVLVIGLAFGVRALWARADVRAWMLLVVGVFLAESLVWTLHSTRGSYFHSLAAFYVYGVAIAIVGAERALASRDAGVRVAWTWGTLFIVAAISAVAVQQWDVAFNGGARERLAALDAIPSGSFLAIDAAAWRWLSGRTVLFTPSDGVDAAACLVNVPDPHANALVLEAAHFRAYDDLYAGRARPSWLGAPVVRGPIEIFPVVSAAPCAIAFGR